MGKVVDPKDFKVIIEVEEGNKRTIDDVYNSKEFRNLIQRLLFEKAWHKVPLPFCFLEVVC